MKRNKPDGSDIGLAVVRWIVILWFALGIPFAVLAMFGYNPFR
jgi:hypothetical protein